MINPRRPHRSRLAALTASLGFVAVAGTVAIGCLPSATPPDAIKVFNPDPGRNFQAPSGLVKITNLTGANAVCFTTNGSNPVYNYGTCIGGSTLTLSGTSLLLSCSSTDHTTYTEKTIKLVFDWPDSTNPDGYSENRVEGTFILDCAPPGTPQDADNDGILDAADNCPVVANPDQADSDADGIGDVCDIVIPDTDADDDGIDDTADNCPNNANANQADADHDGIGDVCDPVYNPDTDGDGITDAADNCPNTANADQADADGDHIGDICDPAPNGDDPDGDGIPALYDNCPNVANTNQLDSDHDGIGNACDADAAYVLLKVKVNGGRCLRVESGNDVKSTSSCSAGASNQQWEMIDVSSTVKMFKNRSNNQCLTQQDILGWKDQLTANCNSNDNKQKWTIEPYTQGGADAAYPVRLHNVGSNFCIYTDGTGNVFGTLSNCGLAGTDANRKIGIYFGGNFNSTPFTP